MHGDLEKFLLIRVLHEEANRPLAPLGRRRPILAALTALSFAITTGAAVLAPVVLSGDPQALIVGAFLAAFYWIPAQLIYNGLIRAGLVSGYYLHLAWTVAAWALEIGFHYHVYEMSQLAKGY